MRFPALIAMFVPPLIAAVPATAQQQQAADAPCTAAVAPPPELASWTDRTPVSAGVRPGDGATVPPGKAVVVALHRARHLALAPAVDRDQAGYGGTLVLQVQRPGTYRVVLDELAWVELLLDGQVQRSIGHADGPRCTGIAKTVDFALQSGNHVVALTGTAGADLTMLVEEIG